MEEVWMIAAMTRDGPGSERSGMRPQPTPALVRSKIAGHARVSKVAFGIAASRAYLTALL